METIKKAVNCSPKKFEQPISVYGLENKHALANFCDFCDENFVAVNALCFVKDQIHLLYQTAFQRIANDLNDYN